MHDTEVISDNPARKQSAAKVKILAVDDLPANLVALEMMLQSVSVELVKARSGDEALRRLLEDDVALILMDVQMPGLDGFETAALIRQRERTRHVPIVFLTASYHSDMHMKGYSLGAVDYINKPIVPEVLQAKVSVFVELFRKTEEVKQQAELLRDLQRREHEREFAEARQEWKEQSQRDTEAAKQKLMAIFEATPDLIAIVSPAGILQYMNRGGRRMLGLGETEDVLKLKLAELRSEQEGTLVLNEALPSARRDGIWRGETAYSGPEGKAIRVSQVILAHASETGEVEFFSMIARDITEQRELEQQFRQAQKLDGIGRLAGGIAHDFNNLLTVILGRSQMLQSKLDSDSPLRRDADLIYRTGERAAALTHQLLAFSRSQVLRPRILDLNAVVTEMEKMLRRLIGEEIELTTALAPALGRVKADPGQIEQVILNLAVNARDAMPSGGKIMIETANADLDQSYAARHVEVPAGPYIMLAVSDTGCGMSPEVQSRAFEPFFTTKEEGKGTGLGLATVYGIVKQTGGNIWLYSEVDRGTTFKVYLPRINEAAETHQANSTGVQEPIRGFETILLVEDNETVREHTNDILAGAGYNVLIAEDVEDAQRLCSTHQGHIHMMLSDVVMPRMKGPDLAKHCLSTRPDMKVLFVSGYTNASVTDHGIFESGAAFLEKPFAADTLLSKVREVLRLA
jgi:PAS domain S-box-containing protein